MCAGLARALLQATVDALQRVLLHGGACRWGTGFVLACASTV